MPIAEVKTKVKRRSPRGNWLVVKWVDGKIDWCTWVQTWAGVQASKRYKVKYLEQCAKYGKKGRVDILDIERMCDYAVTAGYNEMVDLETLFNLPEKENERP